MRNILFILILSLSTSIYSQTKVDEDSLVTEMTQEELEELFKERKRKKRETTNSIELEKDSLVTEMTQEELEELFKERERKKLKRQETINLIYNSTGVQQNLIQDKQDYTNFYYRKRKHQR